jgi:hypothetical protein
MVSGHFGQVGPNVTSRVVREGNYEQEDVQIKCSRIKEGIVYCIVYKVVIAQEETVQVYNYR